MIYVVCHQFLFFQDRNGLGKSLNKNQLTKPWVHKINLMFPLHVFFLRTAKPLPARSS